MAFLAPYHEWVRSLTCTGYVNLKFLDEKVMQKLEHTDATCTVLRFSEDGTLKDCGPVSDADFDRA